VCFSDGFVPVDALVEAIAAADAGLVAMRRDPFRDLTIPGKLLDFVAMGRPVAVSRTRSVLEAFGEDCFEAFDSGDVRGLAGAIRRLHDDPGRARAQAARAAQVAEPYRWSRQRQRYLELVEALVDRSHRRARPGHTLRHRPR
jgi:glycosyltransferase involved in cell wall biosynthesis